MLNSIVGILGNGAAAGGGTSFESIATVTVGSGGSSTITFSSIPSTYTHLQIRAIMQNSSASDSNCTVRFNSDSGSNYSYHSLNGDGASASANSGVSQTGIQAFYYNFGGYFASAVADILDYSNTNKYKTMRSLSGWDKNGSGTINFRSSSWQSTSAISTITITADSGSFAQYSHFALYGIKGA